VSDDATVAEMSELDSSNTDIVSSVISVDNTLVVSSVETSADNNSIVVSAAAVNDTDECSAMEPGTGIQSVLTSSSPSKLIMDTLSDAGVDCDVQEALEAENVETVDKDRIAVCETTNETSCNAVVTESLPPSSDVSVMSPIPSAEVGECISQDDAADPGDMQLDIAECVEIGDTAD